MGDPCTFFGDETLAQRTDRARPHYCRLHGDHCLPVGQGERLRSCQGCPDWQPDGAAIRTSPFVRNLIYHIYPVAGNDAWRWNLQQLLRRIDQFNGRRIFGVATGPGCDSLGAVHEALGKESDLYVFTANNPDTREGETLLPMLDLLCEHAGTGPEQITFMAHAKGVTHGNDGEEERTLNRQWTRTMYEVCLDRPALVEKALASHCCAGAFLRPGKMSQSSAGWHYSGSFAWFRNADLFARRWRELCPHAGCFETFLGARFARRQAACLFGELPPWPNSPHHGEAIAIAEGYEAWLKVEGAE